MKEKRVSEKDIIKPALIIIRDNPGIDTTELIKELQKVVQLYPGDRKILDGRTDNKFSQIVRNLVSHIKNNKFGKCVELVSTEGNKVFFINENGEKEISGYENKKNRDEVEDNLLQTHIRKCNKYSTKSDLQKADIREPEKLLQHNGARYKTDPRISKTVLENKKYICDIQRLTGEKHKTFETINNNQYMEGHHLIPMKAQKDYKINIDRSNNICCLCPNCHRAIHYGTIKEKMDRLAILYKEKIKMLNNDGIYIDLEELINKYYL